MSTLDAKGSAANSETPEAGELKDTENGYSHIYDPKEIKRLVRKIDLHIIPLLAILYLFSFLDRSNIGNARLAYLEETLHINPKSLGYNNALAIFFPFYVFAEVPSNLMMKATRPSFWLPFIMVLWGAMCIALGLVKHYEGLLAVRAALGLAEGGLFPGITWLITMWYPRHECGSRMAWFFSAATAAGAFGGLLARAIMQMDHMRGLRAWSWIFILEGTATVLCAIIAFFVMYDYPDTAKFLTEEEKYKVVERLDADRGSLDDKFAWRYVLDAFTDWKIWIMALICLGIFGSLYSFALFLPTIVKSLGYTNNTAQLMTVPPYVFACLCCLANGYFSDRFRQRGIFIIGFMLTSILGAGMLLGSTNDHVKYAGTFFFAGGVYSTFPAIIAWNGNNVGGSLKRGIAIAIQGGMGNLGGVISAYLFLGKDAPQYRRGHGGVIALCGGAAVLSLFMTVYLRRENARRDAKYKSPDLYTAEEKKDEAHKGDYATFFRYTI